MTKFCRASGCNEAATGYSTHCDTHKQALRRHGDPMQTGVTVHELRPYVDLVDARKAKNPDSEAWTILGARWGAIVAHARQVLQRYDAGQASVRHEVKAAHQLVTVADNVEPWPVVRTALAMYVLQDQKPRRFASDTAFRFQMVRRVRGLAPANAGTYWDHKAGRSRRVYRDLPPSVIEVLGAWQVDAFGGAGLALAGREREEAQRQADERQRLADALGAMK